MEIYIYKYLTRHYELGTSDEASKKIKIINAYGIYYRDDDSKTKREIINEALLKEIGHIFGISSKKAKTIINKWAKSIDRAADLKEYWAKIALLLPIAMQVMSGTIGMDLVAVQPMNAPTKMLRLFDFDFSAETETRHRITKIDIINKLYEEQQKMRDIRNKKN